MKHNRISAVLALLVVTWILRLEAQDRLPLKSQADRRWQQVAPRESVQELLRILSIGRALPSSFRGVSENRIEDPDTVLSAFWGKLVRPGAVTRIVHVGDSHIRGHVLAYEVRRRLEENFGNRAVEPIPVSYTTSGWAVETGEPGIVYHIFGINGATCATFLEEGRVEEINAVHPDLIILSFGTNEANVRNYDAAAHRSELTRLYEELRAANPAAVFLMTTPPGAYLKVSRRRRVPNPNTDEVVSTQLDVARAHHIPVWNLFHIVGGQSMAIRNWLSMDAYQTDRIHFTHEGYRLQGRLLHEALIKSYNVYVANRHHDF